VPTDAANFEVRQILAVGNAAGADTNMRHLRSKLVVLNYLRIANEIARHLPPTRSLRLLDWGALAGQMSYLLARRGLDVTSYHYDPHARDFDGRSTYHFTDLELPLVTGNDPVALPFSDASFAAVLSCGVLEHVDDERGSLREMHRILKPGGVFFIYQLPQKGSWLEYFIRHFKLGYTHERYYTAHSIQRLLAAEGFEIQLLRRANMLPKSFTGLPLRLKHGFEMYPTAVLSVDHAVGTVPLLNHLAGVLEITAVRKAR
jgi:SAM-dependent methyltransferase